MSYGHLGVDKILCTQQILTQNPDNVDVWTVHLGIQLVNEREVNTCVVSRYAKEVV